jgi:GAF domain-containing protein
MYKPNAPVNEDARLKKLYGYNILDTDFESTFDRLANLAARTFGTAIAAIGLVDANRVWFKAAVGLETRQIPRESSFCTRVVLNGQPLIVPDTKLDVRFMHNGMVIRQPFIRFYAGVPLRTPDGFIIGTLYLADSEPRDFASHALAQLENLAATVTMQLELRLSVIKLREIHRAHTGPLSKLA